MNTNQYEADMIQIHTPFHFISGVIAYYIGFPLIPFIILHILWEIVDNTRYFRDRSIKMFSWLPFLAYRLDTVYNSQTDNIFAILGWYTGKWISEHYSK